MTDSKFLIGAATAAHQVEGNNIHSDNWVMENLEHSTFVERSGDAVDHYNKYEEDIKMLATAGCNAYRFSIEWARIEPKEGFYDEKELEHYRAVLDCCEENHITPIVTLHHFSSPAWLIGKGGWGVSYVEDAFARYVEYVVSKINRKIPYICTINEANMGFQLQKVIEDMMKSMQKEGNVQVGVNMDMSAIMIGLEEQAAAFGCDKKHINTFLAARSQEQEKFVMRAHQKAYQAIKNIYPDTKVGLTLSLFDYQPVEGGEVEAERLWEEDFGFYLPFIKDDDFLGVQNYSRKIVAASGAKEPADGAPLTQMGYEDYPASIGHVLRKVASEFQGELMVTENGIATSDDKRRCEFIKEAYEGVQSCVRDGLPVIGYCHWSLLDNFEWQAGFGKTFGLIAVDRTTQERTPKESLKVLGSLPR
ncbi:MAG: family 1 glycosylhydrolase [Lachnospiraceae bacterium]|nr:family 1 glycosylhydrolase [Lachnospiraceae bacterium]